MGLRRQLRQWANDGYTGVGDVDRGYAAVRALADERAQFGLWAMYGVGIIGGAFFTLQGVIGIRSLALTLGFLLSISVVSTMGLWVNRGIPDGLQYLVRWEKEVNAERVESFARSFGAKYVELRQSNTTPGLALIRTKTHKTLHDMVRGECRFDEATVTRALSEAERAAAIMLVSFVTIVTLGAFQYLLQLPVYAFVGLLLLATMSYVLSTQFRAHQFALLHASMMCRFIQ